MSIVAVGFPLLADAHQPKFVDKQNEIQVIDPEVSKAYYGELTGQPAVYTVASGTEFNFYVGILSPDLPNARTDYQVKITDNSGKTVANLNSPLQEWKRWHEEFAGDWYLEGPDFKTKAGPDTYAITVSNPTNSGKYVLAVGELEVFGGKDSFNTMKELYRTKTEFFEKPWYSIFQGKIGNGLLILVLVLTFLTSASAYLILRQYRTKRKK